MAKPNNLTFDYGSKNRGSSLGKTANDGHFEQISSRMNFNKSQIPELQEAKLAETQWVAKTIEQISINKESQAKNIVITVSDKRSKSNGRSKNAPHSTYLESSLAHISRETSNRGKSNENLSLKIRFRDHSKFNTVQTTEKFRMKILEQMHIERRIIAKKTTEHFINQLNIGINSIEGKNALREQLDHNLFFNSESQK